MKIPDRLAALAACAALSSAPAFGQAEGSQAKQAPSELAQALIRCDHELPHRGAAGVLSLLIPGDGFAVADPSSGRRVYFVDEDGLGFSTAEQRRIALPSVEGPELTFGLYELNCLGNPAAEE